MLNKELDRHWQTKERENHKIIKATRRAARDRKRLEMGSAYHSSEDEKLEESEEESESSSYDSEEGEEEESEMEMNSQSDYNGMDNTNNPIMELVSPLSDDVRARSAVGRRQSLNASATAVGGGEPSTAVQVVNMLQQKDWNIKNSGKSPSKRSSRSKHSLMNHFHFNPIRFLAMQLISKNRDRKDSDGHSTPMAGDAAG